MVHSYNELMAYRKALKNTVDICKMVRSFPNYEQYGLAQQLRRSAVSIPSNIAEGFRRGRNEYKHFLRIALGSASELETQLLIAKELGYLDEDVCYHMNEEVTKLLVTYLKNMGTE